MKNGWFILTVWQIACNECVPQYVKRISISSTFCRSVDFRLVRMRDICDGDISLSAKWLQNKYFLLIFWTENTISSRRKLNVKPSTKPKYSTRQCTLRRNRFELMLFDTSWPCACTVFNDITSIWAVSFWLQLLNCQCEFAFRENWQFGTFSSENKEQRRKSSHLQNWIK